jgi:hypothetical protein
MIIMSTTETPVKSIKVEFESCGFTTLAGVAIGVCVFVETSILISWQRFSSLFEDFEMHLPLLTQFVIGPVLPLWLAFVIVGAVAKEFVPGLGPYRHKCNSAILFVGAACLGLYLVGVFSPLLRLITELS